jgi:hypothetical protein
LNAPIVNPFGSKCEFVFFDGQRLKEGWEYAGATTSFTYKPEFVSAVPQRLGHDILQSPARGSRDLKFVVRVWADPGFYGEFRMQSLNIKGPWHKPISEAFE